MDQITRGNVTITFQAHRDVTVFGRLVRFRKPKIFPVMRIDGTIAMSASPQEVLMMKQEAKKAGSGGLALVAGLGLGVILEALKKKKYMIHVVEKNADVVAAYSQYKNKAVDYDFMHLMTIEKFLETGEGNWDFIHLDTWYALDYEFLPHINWLISRARARLHPKGKVVAWGYDYIVKNFVKECMRIYGNPKMVKEALPESIDRLELRMPMIGKFSRWLKKDITVERQIAVDKAHLIAAEIRKFDVPLECVDDINAIKESWEGWKPIFAKHGLKIPVHA